MYAYFPSLFLLILAPVLPHAPLFSAHDSTTSQAQTLEPFTGKITRNKVRMRLQPSLDAPILSEFSRDDLVNVVGEVDEFYAILPPKEIRAYIFRTFVLDGAVEGNRVNVRLEPALEAPIIAQLNSGDRIKGVVSALSSKWLEIDPPISTRFFVCKEYVEKKEPTKNSVEPVKPPVITTPPLSAKESNIKSNEPIAAIEIPVSQQPSLNHWKSLLHSDKMTGKMAAWIPTEKALYEAWRSYNSHGTPQEYYEKQMSEVVELKGMIQPSSRQIKNKPGDYLLVSATTSLPIAYLYSTQVDLQESSGREVIIQGIKRPNNHFAFPAYFVVLLE